MEAYETDLTYSGVTGDALIVETENPWRLVCWEKAQYAPCWDVGDAWFTSEWLETMGTRSKGYNFEPIHDKECRYSKVDLVSRGDARCVVHWDYAVNNTRYELFHGNTTAEETYHVYPPGYAVRELVAHPGNQHTEDGQPTFIIFPTSQALFPHAICPWCNESNIPVRFWPPYGIWPHWPIYEGRDFRVSRPGHLEGCKKQATHTSIFGAGAWYMHPEGRVDPTVRAPWWVPRPNDRWLFLTGATDRDDAYLLDLTRSWLIPARVTVAEGGRFMGYDYAQMTYGFLITDHRLSFNLEAEGEVLNPVFTLLGWELERVNVFVDGEQLSKGEYRPSREDATMVVFVEHSLPPDVTITLTG